MGYSALVKSNVDRAFKMLGDLVSELELTEIKGSGYDFGSNQPISTAPVITKIKGVLVERVRKGVLETSFLVSASDLPAPELYDTIKDSNNKVWKIVAPASSDGYTTTIRVTGG